MTDMQRVGVVGAGLMGSGIAEVHARAGLDVQVTEVSQPALDAGLLHLHDQGRMCPVQLHQGAGEQPGRHALDHADP